MAKQLAIKQGEMLLMLTGKMLVSVSSDKHVVFACSVKDCLADKCVKYVQKTNKNI